MVACATITSAADLVPHYRAVRARRLAAEQAAEMRRRLPAVISVKPVETRAVVRPAPAPAPRISLPALVFVPPWEALRPDGYVAPGRRPTIREVQDAVCGHYKIILADLRSSQRHHPLVLQRQVAMYLAMVICRRSLPETGRMFGGRDQTTAMYARNKIAALISTDQNIRDDVAAIKARLGVGVDIPGVCSGVMR